MIKRIEAIFKAHNSQLKISKEIKESKQSKELENNIKANYAEGLCNGMGVYTSQAEYEEYR